jgi:hypothetical protein
LKRPAVVTPFSMYLSFGPNRRRHLEDAARGGSGTIQRAKLLLRRQYNYIRRKTNPSLELRAVLEEIQSRMSFVLSIMSIEIHIHCDLFQQQW